MLRELIRFEWRYHTRQPAFFAAAALFFLLGFALTGTSFGADNVAVTSPYLVMECLGFVSLLSVFAIATFVANAVIRDSEHRMEEIVFTTPIGRFNYLAARFGGAFLATLTTISLAPLGMIIASQMPWIAPERVGPLRVELHLWSLVVMVVPTLLFATALLFTVATLTRSALATYTASVFIYLLYMVVSALTDSPLMAGSRPGAGGGFAAALLDPFGLSSFFEVTRYWTIVEKNQRFVTLHGSLLLNRVLWLAAAAPVWGVAFYGFKFRVMRKTKEKKTKRDTRAATPVPYTRVEPQPRSARAAFAGYLSATKSEVAAALRSVPFLLLLALWFILALFEIRAEVFQGEYGSAFYPVTALIVSALRTPLGVVGFILVIYYGAELFWREQRYRIASLIDSTPIRGAAMALAKWSALVVLICTTIAIGIVAGVVTQVASGHFDFQPLLYLSLFYFVGLPLALYAAAAVAIHSLSPGKYAGLLLVVLFVIATRQLGSLGFEHPLFRFASGPSVGWSDLHGFSDALRPFGWLMLHWSVWAALFLGIAALAWRHLRDGASLRIRAVARDLARRPVSIASFVALLLVTGGWVYYDTNVAGRWRSSGDVLDWKGDYEKKYRSLASVPQPRIDAVKTSVDFFPEERRVRIAGTYALVNDTDKPIPAIHVSVRREALQPKISVASARVVDRDDRFGMHQFELAQPLQPGARTTMQFELAFDYSHDSGSTRAVTDNGSLVMSFLTFPSLGYRPSYELSDARERAKRGLGKPSTPELEDPDAIAEAGETSDMLRVWLDATVSTSADQTAFTSGRLQREWSANGRRYFHYKTGAPIRNTYAFTSARYKVATRKVNGIDITLAYHPSHGTNVDAMLDAAVWTIGYAGREFGPYPHRQLKLIEVPSSWAFGAFAVPDTVLYNETRNFLIDARDRSRIDLVGRRSSHEIAHQWWGHQVVPASRGGATTIVESLTKYTELMFLEQTRGRDHVRKLLELEHDRYLAGRSGEEERERTLANSENSPYLYYAKGALVTYAIRDLIGERALNEALRRLVTEHGRDANATTLDLLANLRAVSTPEQYALIEQWMQKIVLYDFRLDDVKVEPIAGGQYRVTTRIIAAKHEATSDGTEKEIPFDEALDIALYRAIPDDTPSGEVLVMERHRLRSGVNEVTFTVKEKPVYVEVDPYVLRIDKSRADNAKRL
jgi:ABC-type transport system involved in multi-copper enzyme maturation permease subunit